MRTNIPLSREYAGLANMYFYGPVKHFAFYKGIKALTWADQWAAFRAYIEVAKILN